MTRSGTLWSQNDRIIKVWKGLLRLSPIINPALPGPPINNATSVYPLSRQTPKISPGENISDKSISQRMSWFGSNTWLETISNFGGRQPQWTHIYNTHMCRGDVFKNCIKICRNMQNSCCSWLFMHKGLEIYGGKFLQQKKVSFYYQNYWSNECFFKNNTWPFSSSFAGNQISLLPLTLNFAVIGFKLSQQMMEFFHSLTSKMVRHKKNGVKSYPQSWLKVILQMLNMDYHSNYWKFITLLKRHSNGVLQHTVFKGCLLF